MLHGIENLQSSKYIYAVFKVIFFLTWDPPGLLECCEEMTVQSTTIEGALYITKMFFRATL